MPKNNKIEPIPDGYDDFIQELKTRIQHAQVRAALSINRELILLYWQIGSDILKQQESLGWGAKVIDKLSADLRSSFPDMTGFSVRNLKYMRAIAEAYPDLAFVQRAVAQIPWGHNVRILDQVKDEAQRCWYIEQTSQNGWSRDVLVHQIESGLYSRQGNALTNFSATLPKPQSDLAQQLLKDPYNFEFLTLDKDAKEKELEAGLLEQLRNTLLELGVGFAFVGSQYHLEVGNQDYYIDLLFFHWKLNCFVVVELKVTEFMPEYAGKMAFYLTAVDDLLRLEGHQPTVGLLLCKTTNRVVAEYALRNSQSPMGVSEYKVNQALPSEFDEALPALETIEKELETRFLEVDDSFNMTAECSIQIEYAVEIPLNLFNHLRVVASNNSAVTINEPHMLIQNELISLDGQSSKHTLFCEMLLKGANATLRAAVSPKGDAALKSMMMKGKTSRADYAQSLQDVSKQWELNWDELGRKWLGQGKVYTNYELAVEIYGALK